MDGIHRSSGLHGFVLVEPALPQPARPVTGRSFRDLVRDEAAPEGVGGIPVGSAVPSVRSSVSGAETARSAPEIVLRAGPCVSGTLVSDLQRRIEEVANWRAVETQIELEASMQDAVVSIVGNIGDTSHRTRRTD
jgi:hypothetical protein